VDAEIWNILAPHVCALPTRTTLNVNTAAAPLLQALVEEFSTRDAEQLVEVRGEAGYASVEEFLQQELFAGRELESAGLSVTSQYFLVRSEITIGTARARLFSVVERQANGIRTLARTQGTW
jgi:general secretion pathway protein K